MNDLLVEILNTYGYLGIAFLIMIENIFPLSLLKLSLPSAAL